MVADGLSEEEIRAAFEIHDSDKTGFVSSADLRSVLTSLGEQLTDDEVDEMIREAGQDDHDRIDYNEFIQFMVQK